MPTPEQPTAPPTRPSWRRAAKATGIALVVAVLSIGAYFGSIQIGGNVHLVEPGQLYRSAQLGRSGFAKLVRQHGIRTIVNLRGAHPGASWYDGEIAVSDSLGVTHYDFGLSATHMVTPAQIDSILRLLRAAPKPILIHCQSGSDRSGLVAALYEAEIAGKSDSAADDQLSLRYGHFPYLTSKTVAMDRSYWDYVTQHRGGIGGR
jgi:protein tyrosine/serine phosphatase